MICCCQTQCCMGACKTVSRLLPLRPCFSLAEMSLQLQIIGLRWVRDGFTGRPKAATQIIISSLLMFFGSANILSSWLWVSFLSEKGSRRFWDGRGGGGWKGSNTQQAMCGSRWRAISWWLRRQIIDRQETKKMKQCLCEALGFRIRWESLMGRVKMEWGGGVYWESTSAFACPLVEALSPLIC